MVNENFGVMIVNWEDISTEKNLDYDFIREHKEQLHWDSICEHSHLSVAFLEEMKDYISWPSLCRFQNIDVDFLMNHLPHLSIEDLDQNSHFQHRASLIRTFKNMYTLHWGSFYEITRPVANSNYPHVVFDLIQNKPFHPILDKYQDGMRTIVELHHDRKTMEFLTIQALTKRDMGSPATLVSLSFSELDLPYEVVQSFYYFAKKVLVADNLMPAQYRLENKKKGSFTK